MTGSAAAAPGAVLVRSADPGRVLQGLRTALSLAMGDRPAVLYLAGPAAMALLGPVPGELGANLGALPEAGVAILVEAEAGAAVPAGARRVTRDQLLSGLASAEFQQTF